MTTRDFSREATLKKISILENRLAQTNNSDDDMKGLFPNKGVCLYFYLLGDAYLSLSNSSSKISNETETSERSLQAFESGVSAASNSLEIVDRKLLQAYLVRMRHYGVLFLTLLFLRCYVLFSSASSLYLLMVQRSNQIAK